MKVLLYIYFILLVLSIKTPLFASDNRFLNEGLTENQITNIRIYTIRALNLVLDAYSSLNKKRIIRKESFAYLDGAQFFLAEANQYSPSYLIKREIEALRKRIKFYPDENYSIDIRVLKVHIEEISNVLENYDNINNKIKICLELASNRDNTKLSEVLEKIQRNIMVSYIDEPIEEARNLISIAKDHLKAREYKKSKQSLELALTPLIRISEREYLYIALVKEYIYKAFYTINILPSMAKRYLESALFNCNKAFLVSTDENRNVISQIKDKLAIFVEKFEKYPFSEEDFYEIIDLLDKI